MLDLVNEIGFDDWDQENYEPLWDDLYLATKARVRAIWFADSSHQGASGVLNEDLQGDDRTSGWFKAHSDMGVYRSCSQLV